MGWSAISVRNADTGHAYTGKTHAYCKVAVFSSRDTEHVAMGRMILRKTASVDFQE